MLELDDVTPGHISSIVSDLGPPVEVKECFNITRPQLYLHANTGKTIWREIDNIKMDVTSNIAKVMPLIMGKFDSDRYNLAFEPMCIVEEVNKKESGKFVHSDTGFYQVELCHVEDNVMPWIISDIQCWPDKPECRRAVSVPTAMSMATQFEVWAVLREVVEKLVTFGFKNSFINATVEITSDGSVRIHDLYPTMIFDNVPLYRHVYQNGDTLRAHCDVSLDQEPLHLKQKPKKFAMKAYLTVFTSGPVENLINMKKLKSNKFAHALVPDDATIQIQNLTSRPSTSRTSTPESSRSHKTKSRSVTSSRTVSPDSVGSKTTSRTATPDTVRCHSVTPDRESHQNEKLNEGKHDGWRNALCGGVYGQKYGWVDKQADKRMERWID